MKTSLLATMLFAWPALAQVPYAYVANYTSNNVSVIDRDTNTVATTIAVGKNPLGIAVTPDGSSAYVANTGDGTVSVIATATNTVTATIPGSAVADLESEQDIAITPDGHFVYVANDGTGTVSVIATATNTIVATIPVLNAYSVAIMPNGAFVYVTEYGIERVSVIATATNTVAATFSIPNPGQTAWGIAITPDGAFAYVSNPGAGSVSVVSTATNTVVATIPVGANPLGVAISPDGTLVYVANAGAIAEGIVVIATATNTVVSTISAAFGMGPPPRTLAISPDGAFLYATNEGPGTVSVISAATHELVAMVPAGANPDGVAVTPNPTRPDFSLSLTPTALNVPQGSSGTSVVNVVPFTGFDGAVTFSISGLPSGVTAAFTPTSSTSSTTLTLTVSNAAATGTFPLTITGTSGNLSHTAALSLAVGLVITTSETFDQVVANMTPLNSYTFGTASGNNVTNVQQLQNSFDAYGIAGTTVINQQWQLYQNIANQSPNFIFAPDALKLTATIPAGGGLFPGGIDSGQILTQATFQPGVTGHNTYAFKVRMQFPNGPGMWSSLWLYTKQPGLDDGSGIDYVDFYIMQWQNQFDWTSGVAGPGAGASFYSLLTNPWTWRPGLDFSAAYHDYELIWTPAATYKYFDGQLILANNFQWTAKGPAQLGISLAVGSNLASLPGLLPTALSEFPSALSIQSIQIWAQ